jgi:hypothetical protein
MPSGFATSTIACVIWMSARDGIGSPLGWLWINNSTRYCIDRSKYFQSSPLWGGELGAIHLSCFPGPEGFASASIGVGGLDPYPLSAAVALGEGICCYRGSLLVDISIVAQVSLSEENVTPLPSRLALAMSVYCCHCHCCRCYLLLDCLHNPRLHQDDMVQAYSCRGKD